MTAKMYVNPERQMMNTMGNAKYYAYAQYKADNHTDHNEMPLQARIPFIIRRV
jgi:hypothetical protein